MDLIIEAGGSKTSFFFQQGGSITKISKEGFNPSIHPFSQLKLLLEELPSCQFASVFYYGAGVSAADNIDHISKIIKEVFNPAWLEVSSDLMGAARACLGNQAGVISILGTGSASAWYDGLHLDQRVPSGGYLIGDAGSGFELGRKIASLWISGQLTPELTLEIENFSKVNALAFRKQVYSSAFPVKEVAQLTYWILQNKHNSLVQSIIEEHFTTFAHVHLDRYTQAERSKVAFCGSIAHFFKNELAQSIKPWLSNGLIIVHEAGPGLCDFHFKSQSVTH
jgi:glucosamine kinase